MLDSILLLFLTAQANTPTPFFYVKPQIEFQKPKELKNDIQTSIVFDLPITYNEKVRHWVRFFQTNGKKNFAYWLEKSGRYMPIIQRVFKEKNLPQDLAYLAMIESGLSPFAVSTAQAVGYWQFMKPTAERYGLRVNSWLDERRDFHKSTVAAARYLKDMNKMFNNWYLVAAGYNTGENRIKRLIQKHQSKNFWDISESLVQETQDYIPKLIAAVLIAKSPHLYGFRNLNYKEPVDSEFFWAPGGTSLRYLANHIGISENELRYLNPELTKGHIPEFVSGHRIRIPKGSLLKVSSYFQKNDL